MVAQLRDGVRSQAMNNTFRKIDITVWCQIRFQVWETVGNGHWLPIEHQLKESLNGFS